MSILLVVEDDHLIRASLQMLLEIEGYQTHTVENGREALDFLKAADTLPCLIVLDLMMPVMDGAEFRRIQLQDPELASVPVVIVTGRADLKEADDLAALSIIRKPFEADEVLKVIRRHCPRDHTKSP